jgi:O-antigen/teichoic acid export membrane protein
MSQEEAPNVAAAPATTETGRLWLRSFGNLAAGEVISTALRFGALVWVARQLGPSSFGTLTAALVLGGYLAVFAHSGLETLGIRDVSRDPAQARKRIGEIVGTRLLLATAFYGLMVAVMLVLPVERDFRLAVLLFSLSAFTIALDVRWAFVAIHRTRPVAIAVAAGAGFYLTAVLLLVRSTHDLYVVVMAYVGAEAVRVGILALASCRRFGLWRPRLERRSLGSTLGTSLPITLAWVARTLIISLDVVLVKLILTDADAGHYAAANRITLLGIVYLGLYYYNAFLPLAVRAWQAGTGDLRALVRLALRRVNRFGLATAVVATAAAPIAIEVVLGPRYKSTVVLLQVLIWSLLFLAYSGVYSSVLLAVNQQRRLAVIIGVALVVNVVTNLVLLPTVGTVGASLATVAAEMTTLVLGYFSTRPFLDATARSNRVG